VLLKLEGDKTGKEIERECLVDIVRWLPQTNGVHFKQGYLSAQRE
jgi:hypothetical protein